MGFQLESCWIGSLAFEEDFGRNLLGELDTIDSITYGTFKRLTRFSVRLIPNTLRPQRGGGVGPPAMRHRHRNQASPASEHGAVFSSQSAVIGFGRPRRNSLPVAHEDAKTGSTEQACQAGGEKRRGEAAGPG